MNESLVSVHVHVMGGAACFAGSRVPIATVLASLDKGVSLARLQASWPFLTDAHFAAARTFASKRPDLLRKAVVWPASDDVIARADGLRRQSDDFLAFALHTESQAEGAAAASSAYQAGYFALLSALSVEETKAYQEHPNTRAATLGAQRLGLSVEDIEFARDAAEDFYASAPQKLTAVDESLAWAQRVRTAVGWID